MDEEFERLLENPLKAQKERLQEILESNANCEYGKRYKFSRCTTYDEFSQTVPIVSYSDIEPFMERICRGEQRVLLEDEVVYCGVSSGTTGRKKYVPIHLGFVKETELWMGLEQYFLNKQFKTFDFSEELRYVNRIEGTLPSGLHCGSVSAWYYGEVFRQGRYAEVVPYDIFQLSSVRARNYGFLRFSMGRKISRLTAVNPSTLLLIAQLLAKDGENLVRDVRDGVIRHPEFDLSMSKYLSESFQPDRNLATHLEASIEAAGCLTPKSMWPSLSLLSCWVHGGASYYRDDLVEVFGPLPIWDYGYTSTEGRVTVTFDENGLGIPLITSAFFELRLDNGEIIPLVTAEEGQMGELVTTNSRGLYRYRMGDLVTIAGRYMQTPLLAFKGKSSATASLTGEKVTEEQVVEIVRHILNAMKLSAQYFCLMPVWGKPPGYHLAVEFKTPLTTDDENHFAAEFEQRLFSINSEYERKRQTLRLSSTKLRVLRPGTYDRYLDAQVEAGREIARIKTPRITMDLEHQQQFPGRVVLPPDLTTGKG